MHALVIEDDAITAMLIEDELRDLGFSSVDTAATEQEAIAAVARRCPDLVTSDGALLGGNGVNAVKQIRSHFAVPVLFITADSESARLSMPKTPVLEKPFTVSQFVAAVEQTCVLAH